LPNIKDADMQLFMCKDEAEREAAEENESGSGKRTRAKV
jgi:hypothetical protein